jgi:hypothetical protein
MVVLVQNLTLAQGEGAQLYCRVFSVGNRYPQSRQNATLISNRRFGPHPPPPDLQLGECVAPIEIDTLEYQQTEKI